MGSISTWILSIASVCFISVIADLALPEGKTNSHIKKVISYVIILVVIMPLPKLFSGSFKVDDIFEEIDLGVQDSYIYNTNQSKLDALKESIETELKNNGMVGAVVSVSANIFDVNMEIQAIYVDLYNLVITEELKNINIQTEVVSVVLGVVNIAKDKVIVYEWKQKLIR